MDSTVVPVIRGLPFYPLQKLRVALVLSGGGARGLAHIGVIRALQEGHIPIDLVVGSSIGSVIGGFFAAGYTAEQIEAIAHKIDWNSLFSDETYRTHLFVSQKNIPRRHILQLRFDGWIPYIPSSISQGQKILQIMYSRLITANFQATNDFDRLPIPFRAVATDLLTGKRVVLRSGNLAEAMNASMAVPLLFAPVELNHMLLVDGGITDNLPVDVARQEGADFVIAVDLTSPLRRRNEMRAPWQLADQVTTIMMAEPTEKQRQQADFLIRPDLHGFKAGDFSQIDSLIHVGYTYTRQVLDSLKQSLRQRQDQLRDGDKLLGFVDTVLWTGIPTKWRKQNSSAPFLQKGSPLYRSNIVKLMQQWYETGYFLDITAEVKGPFRQRQLNFFAHLLPEIKSIHFYPGGWIDSSTQARFQKIFQGEEWSVHQLLDSLKQLEKSFLKKGYTIFSIDSLVYRKPSDLAVYLNPGVIDSIVIKGNRKTRRWVILREFPLKEGSVFNGSKAIAGIQNIYSTGLFDRVLVNIVRQKHKNVLIIKVKEKHSLVMRLGSHVSLERGSEAFAELLEDNFLGSAIKLSILGVVGDMRRELGVSAYDIRIWRSYLTWRLDLFYKERRDRYFHQFRRYGDYTIIRRGMKFLLGQQIHRLGLISAGIRFENISVMGNSPEFPYQKHFQLRSLVIQSVVDRRDRLPFPNKGIYNRWYWESGNSRILASSTAFTRVFLGLEGYYPVGKAINYHPFLYAGSGDITIPFSEYFRFGGQQQFPGYYQEEFRGRQIILAGIDWRYRLPFRIPESYLKVNYTIGGAWERPDDRIQRRDFQQSVSGTIALNTLIGPIQFTFARLLHHRTRLYLSLGFRF